jgi:ABC-type uncharacterized transport system permease subunit
MAYERFRKVSQWIARLIILLAVCASAWMVNDLFVDFPTHAVVKVLIAVVSVVVITELVRRTTPLPLRGSRAYRLVLSTIGALAIAYIVSAIFYQSR